MASICVDNLPKVLGLALTELFLEQKLIQWNIHSNGGNVNVSLRFAMADQAQSSMSHTVRTASKSPSQMIRDNGRSMSWHQSTSTPMTYQEPNHGFYSQQIDEDSHIQTPQKMGLSECVPSYMSAMAPHSGQITEAEPFKTDQACELKQSGILSGEIDDSKYDPDIDISKQNTETYSSDDFSKIVIDHRGVLQYNTVRGITKDKRIVSYELGKETDFFHVIERSDENSFQYDGFNCWITSFNEIRNESGSIWETEMQKMLKSWDEYKRQEGIS